MNGLPGAKQLTGLEIDDKLAKAGPHGFLDASWIIPVRF
jgi:hypothetical protein